MNTVLFQMKLWLTNRARGDRYCQRPTLHGSPPGWKPTHSIPLHATYQAYLASIDRLYRLERAPVVNALEGKSVTIDNMEIRRPDKTIPIDSAGTPIYEERGNIAYAIAAFSDITQRKQVEKFVADYNRSLETQVQLPVTMPQQRK